MTTVRVPYFEAHPDAVVRLLNDLAIWTDTPFRANSAAPGARGGVDCVRLGEALLRGARAIPAVVWPRYRIDGGQHLDRSPLLEFLRGRGGASSQALAAVLKPVRRDRPKLVGDAVVIKIGRTPYHFGVVISERGDFVHVLQGRRVTVSSLHDATYKDRLHAVFRSFALEPVSPL